MLEKGRDGLSREGDEVEKGMREKDGCGRKGGCERRGG